MDGLPVITAKEMKRVEEIAFKAGASDLVYMLAAGKKIAERIREFLLAPEGSGTIVLLIGKGNNGGDAFVAGRFLLEAGFSVKAHLLAPLEECSSLSKEMGKIFTQKGGSLELMTGHTLFPKKGIILDGLVGTGFRGEAKGALLEAIEAANSSKLPIFAIDISSGLDASTGEVGSVAIQAEETLYLGLPKIGFYIGKGWSHVGRLTRIDFGMEEKFLSEGEPVAYLFDEPEARASLPSIARDRHKYEAGYVIAIAGSSDMPGAALLAATAALRGGAGIVRLFYPEGMREELRAAPYELIAEGWNLEDAGRIFEEQRRAKALLIGPGMGRTMQGAKGLRTVLEGVTVPTVLDADALYYLAEDPTLPLPEVTILTPHRGEMKRLLGGSEPTIEAVTAFAVARKTTIILKGAPTFVFHPHTSPLIIPRGDPGMATAGSGDVLTGIVAALLAQSVPPRAAAALGVYLHGVAGEVAAANETSYSVIATDLIHYLPEAFKSLLPTP